MECRVFPLNTLEHYRYVVILSIYKEKIMLSRHKQRTTWETQGGHIEMGETPEKAAERELFEESGAVKYRIEPIFDYWAGDEGSGANGMVFLARIDEVGSLPESEMKEISFFQSLPENLTYPDITPVLFQNAFGSV
ncbi:NUDIX domain-containing protein [Clostridium sp. MCC353]|uniref:NUDIX hydrolase n=1 Tax=Clostridium sp. MCC353 TaxID=2592646 RepID=UPI001C00F17A|nr:NUDIX domain-containing protein [Clostridium sp. MCC353]